MKENNERNNVFADSINELRADEISQKKKKKRSLSNLIFDNARYLLISVCAVILVVSIFNIIGAIKGYSDQEKIYDEIGNLVMEGCGVQQMLPQKDMPLTPDYEKSQNLSYDDLGNITNTAQTNKEYERVKIKLLNLSKQYPDLYGWITVDGTTINYPIMQSDDNEYYLDHSYSGVSLTAGSIFADYANDRTLLNNRNLVLYGHHMINTSMFQQLDSFLKASFFKNYGKVTIYTLDGMYTYKVFSVYETNMYYPYIMTHFSSDQRFVEFAQQIQDNSIHQTNKYDFTADSKILTLSTCNNRFEDGRLAVHAVLIDKYENQ